MIKATQQWVASVVVGLNLCPFAGRELVEGRVRFFVTSAASEDELLMALRDELETLSRDPSIETVLLIHPQVLTDFLDYNQFLDRADKQLAEMGLEGVYQVASFHPNYQFSGTAPEDAENYTNRSPYPMLHLLREASLDQVIDEFPDVDQIPARNIAQMKSLGEARLRVLLRACLGLS